LHLFAPSLGARAGKGQAVGCRLQAGGEKRA
jgi:hypothetical protein